MTAFLAHGGRAGSICSSYLFKLKRHQFAALGPLTRLAWPKRGAPSGCTAFAAPTIVSAVDRG